MGETLIKLKYHAPTLEPLAIEMKLAEGKTIKERKDILQATQNVFKRYNNVVPLQKKLFKWQISDEIRSVVSGKSKSIIAQSDDVILLADIIKSDVEAELDNAHKVKIELEEVDSCARKSDS